ncbi:MAG: AMP-binding protein [Candidatus Hydrogenedentes bacterium]|nr:AMP-binding protein [Candidatus Hydrogenedentota bacterium]
MINLAAVLQYRAREHPGRTALISGPETWTYAELDRAANRVANGLTAAGVGPGDKVALSSPTSPSFLACYFGILKMGGVVVALNTLLRTHEVVHHLRDSEAVAYLCHEDMGAFPVGTTGWAAFQEVSSCRHFWMVHSGKGPVSPVPRGALGFEHLTAGSQETFDMQQRGASDVCCIVYTSGTTGQAKGAQLTHANMMIHWLVLRDLFRHTPSDRVLVAAPMYNVLAQSLLMGPAFTAGASLVLLPRFDPALALCAMQEHGVTFFTGVPSMYYGLLNHPDLHAFDLARIRKHWRCGLVGGAPVPPELLEQVHTVFGPRMLIGYGLSETTAATCMHRIDAPAPHDSVGTPIWGVEVRIVDQHMIDVPAGETGEIVVRGHNVMSGYYGKPEANEEVLRSGWLHTGDIGRRDEAGYVYVVDRLKDMIIRGGRKICPSEVEAVLLGHPAVALAAVVGVPHRELGEEVKALVVLKPHARASAGELMGWAKARIAAHAYPRIIEFRDTLPLGPTGKILKKELRADSGSVT